MNQFPQAVLRFCLVGAVVSARRLSLFLLNKNIGMGECRDCILTCPFTTAKLGKNYKITIILTDKICLGAIFFMLKYCKVLHLCADCNLDVADWNFCAVRMTCRRHTGDMWRTASPPGCRGAYHWVGGVPRVLKHCKKACRHAVGRGVVARLWGFMCNFAQFGLRFGRRGATYVCMLTSEKALPRLYNNKHDTHENYRFQQVKLHHQQVYG